MNLHFHKAFKCLITSLISKTVRMLMILINHRHRDIKNKDNHSHLVNQNKSQHVGIECLISLAALMAKIIKCSS
jgi:hypothetical protein